MKLTRIWKGLSRRMSEMLKSFRLVRMEEDDKAFVIAYGSNLSEARMKGRCPGAEVYGTSVIHGYRLLFKQSCTGAYATIEQDANCIVPVVVYRMPLGDEARLDRFEGFPKYYRKQEFLLPVWCLNGKKRKYRSLCIAYIMREHRILGGPDADYFSLLDAGYTRWGFDHEILYKALDDSIGDTASAAWLKRYYEEK